MSAIGPGDWVECVDASPRPEHYGPYLAAIAELRVGRVYQVRGLAPSGIYIVGILSGDERRGFAAPFGFAASRFRPIWRDSKSLIETLLEPLPAGVEPASEPPTPVTPREPMQAGTAAHQQVGVKAPGPNKNEFQ